MSSPAADIDVTVHLSGASINGKPIGTSGPASQFHALLGIPDRIIDASEVPAPPGHRNNQFHYYDSLGVTLNEHHYTHQIEAINFVFDTGLSYHPTKQAFRGEMSLGGLRIAVGTLEQQLADSDLEFTAELPGTWFTTIASSIDNQTITIAVCTQGRKLKSGRRSKTKSITSISLCLPHDPWDTKHIPE